VAQIARSIKSFGFANPILVGDDGEVNAGHGRLGHIPMARAQPSAHAGDLAMKPKTKRKPKTKKQIRRIVTLIHRVAISLHAEAETLQEKTASLIAELDRKKAKRPVRTKKHQRSSPRARRKIH
jgi:hypothetical protein